ncbi:MAG: acylphosphatase [Candidatus Methanodesulfokora sp.]
MPRKRVVIVGMVHDVGYRPLLLGIAGFLGIERFYADNIFIEGKQAVEVLFDAPDDKISAFIDLIKKKKPEEAVVERIDVEDYSGDVMKMEDYYRYLTAMQLWKIASYGGQMLKKQDMMLEKQDLMIQKQDLMIQKQDEMLKKQDEMLKKQDEMSGKMDKMLEKQDLMIQKQDMMLGKMDLMLKKQDETIQTIKKEGRKTRRMISSSTKLLSSKLDNITSLLEERFKKLEEEVERIKKALIKAGIDVQ